jgi:hypothetical protein
MPCLPVGDDEDVDRTLSLIIVSPRETQRKVVYQVIGCYDFQRREAFKQEKPTWAKWPSPTEKSAPPPPQVAVAGPFSSYLLV